MRRLFLDANVLFSAAYRPDAGVRRIWELPDTELVTSKYAVLEARRNLRQPEKWARLDILLERLEVLEEQSNRGSMALDVELPDKDRPILLAAIHARASHLITGAYRHFGPYFGREIHGVRISTPSELLRSDVR